MSVGVAGARRGERAGAFAGARGVDGLVFPTGAALALLDGAAFGSGAVSPGAVVATGGGGTLGKARRCRAIGLRMNQSAAT
jgi:hypothetical protein